jgi:hypothetical protein
MMGCRLVATMTGEAASSGLFHAVRRWPQKGSVLVAETQCWGVKNQSVVFVHGSLDRSMSFTAKEENKVFTSQKWAWVSQYKSHNIAILHKQCSKTVRNKQMQKLYVNHKNINREST